MAYTVTNFKSKKALREALAQALLDGKPGLPVYQPGPFGPSVADSTFVGLEGPHYPEPHRWYASATVVDGYVTAVAK